MDKYEEIWGMSRSHKPPMHKSKAAQAALDELQSKAFELQSVTKLSGWLADVIDNAPNHLKADRVDTWLPARYALIESSARFWIDSFFEELKRFVHEFNNSSAAKNLTIVVENPKTTFELPCRRDPSFLPYKFKCYQGHLATHNCALVIRSYYESMQILIVPPDMLLGLTTDTLSGCDLQPLAEFQPAVKDEQVHWAAGGVTIDGAAIPDMAREIFSDFIKVSIGAVDGSAQYLFAAHPSATGIGRSKKRTIDQDKLSELLRDLEFWQTRDLFSRALCIDIESIEDMIIQCEQNPEMLNQLNLLRHRYAEVQDCWQRLVSELKEMSAGLLSTGE